MSDYMNCKSEVGACLRLRCLQSVFSWGRSDNQAVERYLVAVEVCGGATNMMKSS